MKIIAGLLVLMACNSAFANAVDSYWKDVNYQLLQRLSIPEIDKADDIKSRYLRLDITALNETLFKTDKLLYKSPNSAASKNSFIEIDFPLPDGQFERVRLTEYQLLSPELQTRYPDIRAWRVKSVENENISGRVDVTPAGFHGMLVMPDGDTIYIDPDSSEESNLYQIFSKRDNHAHFKTDFTCDVHSEHKLASSGNESRLLKNRTLVQQPSLDLITYRFAIAGTAEYTASQGGTQPLAFASMITTINRVNEIYQRDIGVRLQLVSDETLMYTNSNSDPYTSGNASALVSENITNLNNVIGTTNYDLGHVFDSSQFGGLAFLGVSCFDNFKAGGATGITNPSGETFSIEYVAHEIGHQLGADHSFNSNTSGCGGGNRNATTAVEPGSGSSIMSYAGLCGGDNVQFNSDATFHWKSIEQINSYTRTAEGSICGIRAATGNQDPVANAGLNINVPINTPFLLAGSATGGSSYSWDQIDTGSASSIDVDTGNNALIRQLLPSNNTNRYLPRLSDLFAGTSTIGEKLPQTSRELNFSFVVRDGSGGISNALKKVTVSDTGSIFKVLSQSTSQNLTTGQAVDIAWEVAGTDSSPIACSTVDISLLQVNGQKSSLIEDTENDGVAQIIIPSNTPIISNGRIMVMCHDQSFFQISQGSISIEEGTGDLIAPVITLLGLNPVTVTQGENYTDAGATATDNIDGNVTVVRTGTVNTSQIGDQQITYTATDVAGNTATSIRTVTVVAPADTVAPVITLIGDATLTLIRGEVYIEQGATATDNVDSIVSVTVTGNVNTTVIGDYTINYSATDDAGNVSNIDRVVSVINEPDTIAPEINLSGDLTINLVVGDSFSEPGFSGIDSRDGVVTVTVSGTVDTNNAGTYILTYIAFDLAGNQATKFRTIIVTAASVPEDPAPEEPVIIVIPDTTPPEITLSGDTIISLQVGDDYTDPGFAGFDNKDGELTIIVEGIVDTSVAGTYTVTYTAIDEAGNKTVKKRTIIVIDPEQTTPDVNTLTPDENNDGGKETSSGGGSLNFTWMILVFVLALRKKKHLRPKSMLT